MDASTVHTLPGLTDATLGRLLAAEHAVLVLMVADCRVCTDYEADLARRYEAGELAGVAVGKLVLDGPGVDEFRRDNAWVGELDFFPYTLLYARGRPVEEFATTHAAYLVERLGAMRDGHRADRGERRGDD